MAYTLFWFPLLHGQRWWSQSRDLWVSLWAGHMVAWGDFPQVYSAPYLLGGGPGLVTFPGIYLVLAPVAWLDSVFHLGESRAFFLSIPEATSIPVLMGWCLLLSCVGIAGVGAVVQRLSLQGIRRVTAYAAVAVAIFVATVRWGHPEEPISVGLALLALVAAADATWSRAAWLLAVAISFQPLAALAVPIVVGMAWRSLRWKVWELVLRAATLPIALIALPLIRDWHHASTSLFTQPTFPAVGWTTPWSELAQSTVLYSTRTGFTSLRSVLNTSLCGTAGGCQRPVVHTTHVVLVNAAHIRLGAAVGAIAIGYWVSRRERSFDVVLAALAAAWLLRCVFEPVMFPYYVTPAVTVIALAAATGSRRRWLIGLAVCAALTAYVWRHGPEWRWYLGLVALCAAGIAAALPAGWRGSRVEAGSARSPDDGVGQQGPVPARC